MCDRSPRNFDVQTSYKPSNYVFGLIFAVNIKFTRATYHTIVPSTEELYCLICTYFLMLGAGFMSFASSFVSCYYYGLVLINNYSPKWRCVVVDICRAAKWRLGTCKCLLLFTNTELNNCFGIYKTGGQPTPKRFLRNEAKLAQEIQNNGER